MINYTERRRVDSFLHNFSHIIRTGMRGVVEPLPEATASRRIKALPTNRVQYPESATCVCYVRVPPDVGTRASISISATDSVPQKR